MKKTVLPLILLCSISLFTPAAVEAEQATWAFEGSSGLTGQFTFEVAAKEYPNYVGALSGIHGSVGAIHFDGPLASDVIEIWNDQGGYDWYRMESQIELGERDTYFEILLVDLDGTIFDSTRLMASPPSLSEIEFTQFTFQDGGVGRITKLSYVPEPITAVLLVAGASWFFGRRITRERDHE